jgi:hypothetical protein
MSTQAITGIGPVAVNTTEYISPAVLAEYTQLMALLKSVYDKRKDNPAYANQPASTLINETDYDTVIQALNGLAALAKNGKTDTLGTSQFQSFITPDMANQIDNVIKSLNVVDISPFSSASLTPDQKIAALGSWQSLAGFGIESILQRALETSARAQGVLDPVTGTVVQVPYTRTLQSAVELDYVKNANTIIFGNLTDLEGALKTTTGILDTLQVVQSISNQISAPTVTSNFTVPAEGSIDDIKNAGKAYFDNQIPIPIPTSTSGYDLLMAKRTLSAQLAVLITQANNKNTPKESIFAQNTLANSIRNVIRDISTAFKNVDLMNKDAVKAAVSNWILDKQDQNPNQGLSGSGDIQENITVAIRNGESLNDQQRSQVRRSLYLFEEFYKSASTMLDRLTTALEKIGGNIGNLK